MKYFKAIVKDNVEVFNGLKHLYLKSPPMDVLPGQFIMLWFPELEEVPMAPSKFEEGEMRITYKIVGETTRYMSSLESGDEVFVRGPLGKPFDISMKGRYLLVGGGVGTAPLMYTVYHLLERGFDFTYVEGVPTSQHKIFVEEVRELGGEAILYTEDGSEGYMGFPTKYIEEYGAKYDFILVCGPEAMNKAAFKICVERGFNCQISMERLVKCGVGVCGSCVVEETGLLVCLDGPVFNSKLLLDRGYDC